MTISSKKSPHQSESDLQARAVERRYVAVQLRKRLAEITVSKMGKVVSPKRSMTMLRPKAIIEPKRGGVRLGQHAHLGLKLED